MPRLGALGELTCSLATPILVCGAGWQSVSRIASVRGRDGHARSVDVLPVVWTRRRLCVPTEQRRARSGAS